MSVFLLTNFQNAEPLAMIGDAFLTPCRYLLGGRTVIQVAKAHWKGFFHVSSFHNKTSNGFSHRAANYPALSSSDRSYFRTILAIITLIPGLFFGVIFKGSAYCLSADTRLKHSLIKTHLTPIDKTIGSQNDPLTLDHIQQQLELMGNDNLHQKTNALIIHGNNVNINNDPGIIKLRPGKLILVNARIVHQPSIQRLDEKFPQHNWLGSNVRAGTPATISNNTVVSQFVFKTVEAALAYKPPRRPWSFKRYHCVCVVEQSSTGT